MYKYSKKINFFHFSTLFRNERILFIEFTLRLTLLHFNRTFASNEFRVKAGNFKKGAHFKSSCHKVDIRKIVRFSLISPNANADFL